MSGGVRLRFHVGGDGDAAPPPRPAPAPGGGGRYAVDYHFADRGGTGTGRADVTLRVEMSDEHVEALEAMLEQGHVQRTGQRRKIVVTGWSRTGAA